MISPSGPTMWAMVLPDVGRPLGRGALPVPTPGPGDVLIRIAAVGLNPLDVKIAAGQAAHAQVHTPAVLGLEVAGTVVETGARVSRSGDDGVADDGGVGCGVQVGDEVYGLIGGVGGIQGGLAEYAAVDTSLLARKPAEWSMQEAAAVPLAIITAWEGLVDRARVGEGDTVLVHGGAGGVGHLAVQLAVARGARVWATGRPGHQQVIRRLGAIPIDAERTTVEDYIAMHTGGQGFDVVFDTLGGQSLDRAFAAVRRYTGRVVSSLGWGTHSLAPLSFRGATYSGVFTLLPLLTGEGRAAHGSILAAAAELGAQGRLRPILRAERYDLDDAGRALEAVARGGAVGRVIVRVT